MDSFDKKILGLVQSDVSLSLADISDRVHLSRNACWKRIRQLEEHGIIRQRVALLDRKAVNVGLTVFISIRAERHARDWVERFCQTIRTMPEIVGIYRTTGQSDYLLHVVVPDVTAYDGLHQRLMDQVDRKDISSAFVMEEIKYTTEVPLDYI